MNFCRQKKLISGRKLDKLIKKQEHIITDKNFQPGLVQIKNTLFLKTHLVNFFGDTHTQAFSVKINEKQHIIGVGCANGEVKVYGCNKGNVMNIFNSSRMCDFPCTSFRWKPKSHDDFVVCNCDGSIRWYNRIQDSPYGHYERNDISYLCSDYQCNEDWSVFGTDKDTLEIFDNLTMKPTCVYQAGGFSSLEINHHINRVFCVKCLPEDSNVFFSGGWDSTIQIWDIRVGNGSVRKIYGPSVSSDSLDYKNGVILVGNYSNNDIAQLYDFGNGTLIQTLDIGEPQNSDSYCLAATFSHRNNQNLLAVGLSGTNTVKIISQNKLAGIIKFQAAPLTLDFCSSEDCTFLVVGGVEGTLYLFKLNLKN